MNGATPNSLAIAARRRRSSETLLLVATIALFASYYLARADRIGSGSPRHDWFVVTGGPLAPTLHYVGSALLLAILPLLAARWLCGLRPRELGLGLGRWREGLAWLGVGIPLAIVAGKIAAGSPAMRAVYPLDPAVGTELARFLPHALRNFLYYGSWEVLFRGVLLFGLAGRAGRASANATQTGLAVTAHFGRPLTETLSALPASLGFGWVSLRLGSMWYTAVIHWAVGTSMDWFILAA
ncbi:MAG: CPBP family intramembrane glutamic endopeptidase [Gemmatimonadota bacterium]